MSYTEAGNPTARTNLAWQRTALSLLVATVVLVRLTHGELGGIAWVAGTSCVGLAAWAMLSSRSTRTSGGTAAAASCACVVLLALTELLALVS